MEGIPAEVVHRRGLYDVTLSRIIQDRSLRQETIFECVLTIPLTPYQITRSLIYYPGLYSAVPPLPSSPQLLIMSPIRLTIISVD